MVLELIPILTVWGKRLGYTCYRWLGAKRIIQVRMDGWVRVLRPFNSISVISRRWKGEHERLCAMKRRLGSGRISPPAGLEPATPWSEVGSANRSATRTLQSRLGVIQLLERCRTMSINLLLWVGVVVSKIHEICTSFFNWALNAGFLTHQK